MHQVTILAQTSLAVPSKVSNARLDASASLDNDKLHIQLPTFNLSSKKGVRPVRCERYRTGDSMMFLVRLL